MKIKLVNKFHGTAAAVIAKRENGLHYVSYSAYKRALRKLCGVEGCQCGGIRGGDWQLEPVYSHFPAENYCQVYHRGARV